MYPLTNKYDYSFTIPEIRIALKTSRSNTAPGSDGIPTRVLQLCELEDDVLNVLSSHSILSNNDNTVPDKWKHSIMVSIPKKGNSSSLENQRGIAKSCAFAKLTNELLLARIRDIIKPQLLGVQSGFRAGRSTVEQTMALRYIFDMCRVSKRMTTIIIVDFSKAFDSIDRRAISIVLSKYGVSELLIANVMQFYIGTSAVVATAYGNTEIFSTTSGVLQGDSLAPFLFITLLDYVLRETHLDNIDGFTIIPRRSTRYPAVRIGALVYADDIAITCDTIEQAHNVFRRLEMNASKVGLKINLRKTKILHAGHNSEPNPVTTINGYTLEICNDILYLGVSTKTPLNVVQEKIGRAWFAIGKLRPIFISKISDANKMRLFKATVETIAAYGLESVPMTRSLCRQIDASHRQLVQAALGITWPESISTAELTQRAKLIPLSRAIRKRRLRLVGHVIRMQSRCQTPLGTLLTTVPSNCHRQGHGRTSTLQHNVADDLRSINCDVTSISGMTK